jgi:hypothetical protein
MSVLLHDMVLSVVQVISWLHGVCLLVVTSLFYREIKLLTELIIKQNYFELNSKFYLQSQGLAMGAPSSALLSEIYLQYIEHNQIRDLLIKHKIISYHRYVDDILIVYNTQ